MRKVLYRIFILVAFQSCFSQEAHLINNSDQELVNKIDSLLTEKSFFRAKDLFYEYKTNFSSFQKTRYNAIFLNLFNEPLNSNIAIDSLFDFYNDKIIASEAKDLLETKLSNCIKLYDYRTVDSVSKILINQYQTVYDSIGIWEVKNNGIIWEAVKNVKKQEAIFKDSSHIKLFKDKAGLKNLNIEILDSKFPFIFDTGANLSVVIESQAEEMGIKEIENKSVSVNTITGQRVEAKIGVCKNFYINNLEFSNVVFLIFPDKILYIPQIDYQIKGILGFPVLSAMKEIHFKKNNEVFVPKKSSITKANNMVIEYLTPYINLNLKNDKWRSFAFDTGASTTFLYKPFFDENKSYVEDNFQLTEINFVGGGGSITVKGYKIPLEISYEDKTVKIDNVSLISERIEGANIYEYGNLGQDFIKQFDTMIINFEKMFVHFE